MHPGLTLLRVDDFTIHTGLRAGEPVTPFFTTDRMGSPTAALIADEATGDAVVVERYACDMHGRLFATPGQAACRRTDVDCDGLVGATDLALVRNAFTPSAPAGTAEDVCGTPQGDPHGAPDGEVDAVDVACVRADLGLGLDGLYTAATEDPDPAALPRPDKTFSLHGLTYDHATGLVYARARLYHPKLARSMARDPKGYVDGGKLYEAFGSNPARFTDPMGTDYVRVDGRDVFWVIEEDGSLYNPDVRAVPVGRVFDGKALLDETWGDGHVRLTELATAANRFWNEYPDISGLPRKSQTKAIAGVIDRIHRGQALGAHGGACIVAAGAAEGAGGGASIVANTFSFGWTDRLGWTDSDQYQGLAYDVSRVSAVVARESLTVVATVGTSWVARGGVEVTKRTQYVARAANRIAKSKGWVKAARQRGHPLAPRPLAGESRSFRHHPWAAPMHGCMGTAPAYSANSTSAITSAGDRSSAYTSRWNARL